MALPPQPVCQAYLFMNPCHYWLLRVITGTTWEVDAASAPKIAVDTSSIHESISTPFRSFVVDSSMSSERPEL